MLLLTQVHHLPTTLHPLILAIWPTIEPTAPAAPSITTVSPSFGKHTSIKHKYAVALHDNKNIIKQLKYHTSHHNRG